MLEILFKLLGGIKNIKTRSIVTTAVYAILFSVLCTGLFLTVDSKYAHASEITELRADMKQQQVDLRNTIKYTVDSQTKRALQDKALDIEDIPVKRRTQLEQSKLNRLNRQIDDLDKRWTQPLR
jgi:septal ring factor EnvC (AmiA/AmiB activator)